MGHSRLTPNQGLLVILLIFVATMGAIGGLGMWLVANIPGPKGVSARSIKESNRTIQKLKRLAREPRC